ncbi:ferredoxin [Trinickia symbiotica]|uniref:Ferredoxin n=1 Tax=Trinickia symbiotica TaxID=863227 RepID=A0A2N7WTG7_9BURK|nr:ferredoxin [Trinickia symbiotica]PMS32632.1 ferredoxin [Trinickia symbiotica]PPK41737.1 ferredoxin [Trinickia symbiotica]
MKIVIRRETCISGGQCVSVAPELFEQDENGQVVLIKLDPSDADIQKAKEAEFLCPSRSISVEESS